MRPTLEDKWDDVAMVLAFTGLRWEEAVAVPIENVDVDGQWITVDRTASESGAVSDRSSLTEVHQPDLSPVGPHDLRARNLIF